jgi:hypothetical protein
MIFIDNILPILEENKYFNIIIIKYFFISVIFLALISFEYDIIISNNDVIVELQFANNFLYESFICIRIEEFCFFLHKFLKI